VLLKEETGGAPPRLLTKTGAPSGSVTFRPLPALQRKRRVVAIVEQDGRPRARLPLATYFAPPPPRLQRVRQLTASRRGPGLALSWRPQAAADKYYVVLGDERGGRRLESVTRPWLALPASAAAELHSVSVRAVGFDGRISPPTSLQIGIAPRLSRLSLSGRTLSLRLSKPATVTIRLARCRVACRPATTLTIPDQPAGTLRAALPRELPPGRYRIVVRAAGASAPLTATVSLLAPKRR
jgi:hypothetical protein